MNKNGKKKDRKKKEIDLTKAEAVYMEEHRDGWVPALKVLDVAECGPSVWDLFDAYLGYVYSNSPQGFGLVDDTTYIDKIGKIVKQRIAAVFENGETYIIDKATRENIAAATATKE